ncbi:hypothetical protein [Candidatus Xenohaliotis californiensis]|uniref:hypothetical protein n=1 Tax=Candidatus Xenohaliotis californiensis TaxID=84677 RepID=UPI0030C835A7
MHMLKVLKQVEKDGRFVVDPEIHKSQMYMACKLFANLHKYDFKDVQYWMDKQVYLNISQFLLGIATLDTDAMSMKGIDTKLDEEFGLREKGFSSLVVCQLGIIIMSFNATKLPKSHLPYLKMLTGV